MKSTVKYLLMSLLSVICISAAICFAKVPTENVAADTGNITCATASGNYLDDEYISAYKVPASVFEAEANGGASTNNPLSYAFDGNWGTFWQTATQNGSGHINSITVTFSQPVTVASILYASSSARVGHGYPTILNIYTSNDSELSLYGTCNSTATNNRVLFSFSQAITVTQIKFEFKQVNTAHNWTATAKEICFMQPDSPNINKIFDLFDDYARFSVKSEYKSQLAQMRTEASRLINYESTLKPLLDRADSIVDGSLKKDSRREFSTDPNAENVINRYGAMRSYAGLTLKMWRFGIDRQVLGVGGLAGQQITIYVEADEGDPLPTISFNQVLLHTYSSWKVNYPLSLGKNVFTFPNFINANYKKATVAGGPIHIINAYTPSQQSSNVKVYIEGGYLYPVFRKGDDIDAFRSELTDYYQQMQSTEGMCDLTELVGDHFFHTVSATNAYNQYINEKVNPQTNAENWDIFLRALLEFGGISFDPADEYYDERNLHLYTNFRMAQPLSGVAAYSGNDHIGYCTFSEVGLINNPGTQTWGVPHEVGHSLDLSGLRMISETTNNMWSKFALAHFNHDVSRNFNAAFTQFLTPDETAVASKYFVTHTSSYQIWWNLESCHHGFWGRLDNMYRYYDLDSALSAAGAQGESLTMTEKMVYYSSLATGEDLGYYYERSGFSFTSDPFTLETASSAYKKLIEKALQDGEIIERNYKYWYVDASQYFVDFSDSGCYTSSSSTTIRDVLKTSTGGYTLLFSEPANSEKHLGYEIMEYRNGNWYVIGFSYTDSFTDNTVYAGDYTPQYKIRAYDRALAASAESSIATYNDTQTSVCRIGETYYNSITEAVAAANAGDTIYVCGDLHDGGVTISKNLTLRVDPSCTSDVVITKSAVGAMFTVNAKVTFIVGNNSDTVKIIFDGNSFVQNGTLITSSGTLQIYNAEFRNNLNTNESGAIYASGNVALNNVIIRNNTTSKNGGGLYNAGSATLTNVSFKDNTASQNGGAIVSGKGAVTVLNACSVIGNHASGSGGGLSLNGSTTLTNCTITGNHANANGGALYFDNWGVAARKISVRGGEFSGNTAGNRGSAIYQYRGDLTFENDNPNLNLSGEIYKDASANLFINAVLPDLSNVSFRTPSDSAGKVVLTATGGLIFTVTNTESIKVNSFNPELGEGGTTVLVPLTVIVTFSVNGTNVLKDVKPGNLVLPQNETDAPEGKEFSHWDVSGVAYEVGDTVEITSNTVITAVFKDIPNNDGNDDNGEPGNGDDPIGSGPNTGNDDNQSGSGSTGGDDNQSSGGNTETGDNSNSTENTDNDQDSNDNNAGANAGLLVIIVIIAVVVVICITVTAIFVAKKKKIKNLKK